MEEQPQEKIQFWMGLMEDFPAQLEVFTKWIDEYKKTPAWRGVITDPAVKFHHLPMEMQVGVVFKFFRERFEMTDLQVWDITDMLDVMQLIKDSFALKFMQDQMQALTDEELSQSSTTQ